MKVIHTHPIQCFDAEPDEVTCSTDIEEVTCNKCVYYYFHPEARKLEFEFRYGTKKVGPILKK